MCSAAILGRARLPTLDGQRVTLTCGADDKLHVNGRPVAQPDVVATNGVIHVLNHVLVPDSGTRDFRDFVLGSFSNKLRSCKMYT